MWGWPVQDIATTLYYHLEYSYADAAGAFQEGYTRISPWPDAIQARSAPSWPHTPSGWPISSSRPQPCVACEDG